MHHDPRPFRRAPLIAVWAALVVASMVALGRYEGTAGAAGAPPLQWPDDTTLAAAGPAVVMFVHPRCPCSRASVRELARLAARLPDTCRPQIVLYRPADTGDEWAHTDLHRSASAIPGIDVRLDAGGVEARRFGARTSGHTVVYDATGRRRFSGGVTSGRGHEGLSAGGRAILALVKAGGSEVDTTPVFGCPIVGRHEVCEELSP